MHTYLFLKTSFKWFVKQKTGFVTKNPALNQISKSCSHKNHHLFFICSSVSSEMQTEFILELLRLIILSIPSATLFDFCATEFLLEWLQKYLSSLVNRILSNPIFLSRILLGTVQAVVIMLPTPNDKNKRNKVGTCQVESGLQKRRKIN